jgi:NAD(P)-dependent dehydrogenase (short-subunit alcohol dehydrogenase family)
MNHAQSQQHMVDGFKISRFNSARPERSTFTNSSVSYPMPQLENQVVLITGAAGSIGSSIAKLFAAEGAAVALLDRADSNLGALALEIEALGARVSVHPTDISDSQEVARAVAGAVEAHGKISSLINAVDVTHSDRLDEMTETDFDVMIAAKLKGVWLAVRHGVPQLRGSENASIINLSTTGAFGNNSSLTARLAKELRSDGIRVNEIALAQTDAELQADQVAQAALYLCSSRAALVTGSVLLLDAGLRNR